ncbi:hypothetical protein HDU98_004184, partial [Podochytrium sp. JEL0797]
MNSARRGGKAPTPKIRAVKKPAGDKSFDDCWAILSSAIEQIHQRNASVLSFEELYR